MRKILATLKMVEADDIKHNNGLNRLTRWFFEHENIFNLGKERHGKWKCKAENEIHAHFTAHILNAVLPLKEQNSIAN